MTRHQTAAHSTRTTSTAGAPRAAPGWSCAAARPLTRAAPRRLLLIGAVAALPVTACSEATVAPEESADRPATARHDLHAVACAATVPAALLSCASATGQRIELSPRFLIVGGQGIFVQLTSSNVGYDVDTEIFQADVTIANLMDDLLGTPDGLSVTGIRIFFHDGPHVTSGDGTVTVNNADGTATFTGANQPYHEYGEMLGTGETSSAKKWKWDVPPTVEQFVFQVLIEGDVPTSFPRESDWVEYGAVLEVGPPGAWDAYWAGTSTPGSVVKKNGTYFLYYGGADGLRSTDGGPRHRAIGVATSSDGISFSKYAGNPVMTYLPHNGEEEGANSAAVVLDDIGDFVMFYGAATQIDAQNIVADGRVAVSSDGVHFTDQGLALDHDASSLYGFGDEIFPLAAYRYNGNWYVYYVVNGGPQARDLAVAWGQSPTRLDDSALVIDGSPDDPAHAGGTVSWLAPDRIVVLTQRGWSPNIRVEVRTAHPESPHQLSRPVRVYEGPLWQEETKFVTGLLDADAGTWLLYRSNWDGQFVLHRAPYESDTASPP